ncbi:alkaline phosphatase [uncultured Formosa sp.]|uniref:alkaline phosphatase n=1 Tax=uncultured Formosa sp. TaxID=255435 RepID=UPI00260867F7|nr:alkaline phosphatase [uncultured Formosa sp.]
MLKKIVPFIILFSFNIMFGQKDIINVHSHNDYKKTVPFWQAFSAGATSIEADVIFKDGKLFVAHEEATILPTATLENLYLSPLKQLDSTYQNSNLDLQLLIDIKTEAYTSLAEVIKVLEPYKSLLKPYKKDGVSIVISGSRPKPSEYSKYPDHIFFDCQEIENTPESSWNKVAMISTSFTNFSKWNGLGRMVESELNGVKSFIQVAHKLNKPIRFWATPDTKTAWHTFYKLGVDYINTDDPNGAVSYLKSLPKMTFKGESVTQAYVPAFSFDAHAKTVKNIIFLIGDGMGLSQVSAGDFMSNNQFYMSKFKSIGLIRTQSADNFGTDSAAGATAYATGERSNNRAISTDVKGNDLSSITEILSKHSYTTGVVTTDHLTGATPAAFYAHVQDRGDTSGIVNDLVESPLDFFVGAGKADFKKVLPNLKKAYTLLDDVSELKTFSKHKKVGLFLSDNGLQSMDEGRGRLMPELINELLPLVKAKKDHFFIMIEGAMIDSYGHHNDARGVVHEVLDFDAMVGEVLKFADLDGETLVVITADHETGGFSLPNGNLEAHTIEGNFTTHDHTGTMVPVFAYGPGASLFQGVYNNSELNKKMLQLLGVKQ